MAVGPLTAPVTSVSVNPEGKVEAKLTVEPHRSVIVMKRVLNRDIQGSFLSIEAALPTN